MKHVRLEVCVDTAAGLQAAIDGRADRIELCAALAVGGLTPSPGLMVMAATAPVPVRAMIRPRAGDFCYSLRDVAQMKADIDATRQAGLRGIVFGATDADVNLDLDLLRTLRNYASDMPATLHRAVDTLANPETAVEQAISLGFDTILTSGGCKTAAQGLRVIARMCQAAAGRIAIMPGSGVRVSNAAEILRTTGVSWLHASCSSPVDTPERLQKLGFSGPTESMTDTAICRQMSEICHQTEVA